MADITVRKQRLRTLEKIIRDGLEQFVQTGFALKEIRDDKLYEEDEFESWDHYLKDRVVEEFGFKETQAREVIVAAQVRLKLPDLPKTFNGNPANDDSTKKAEWNKSAAYEFARLAPKKEDAKGQPFDLDNLNKRDVERVAKKVIQHCEQEEVKPTATIVRQFVDEELGIDRAAHNSNEDRP